MSSIIQKGVKVEQASGAAEDVSVLWSRLQDWFEFSGAVLLFVVAQRVLFAGTSRVELWLKFLSREKILTARAVGLNLISFQVSSQFCAIDWFCCTVQWPDKLSFKSFFDQMSLAVFGCDWSAMRIFAPDLE